MSPHFNIPIPHPSTFAHNLPHPHRSSTQHTSSTHNTQPLSHSKSLPNEHPHVDTPHPHPNGPVSYLDAHVPPFAKHHTEFQVQHSFRNAKREARHTSGTPIPDYILEAQEPEEIHVRTLEEIARDQAEWDHIVATREAARRRVTLDLTEERMDRETKMEAAAMVGRVDTAVTINNQAVSGSEGSISPSQD